METMPSRQKTWFTFPCLYRSLHLPQIYLQYAQRETDTKILLVTCRHPTFLPLIRFLPFSEASEYFRLTNLYITLLSWPLLFLERETERDRERHRERERDTERERNKGCLHRGSCSVCVIALHYSLDYNAPLSPDFFLKTLISPLICCSNFPVL